MTNDQLLILSHAKSNRMKIKLLDLRKVHMFIIFNFLISTSEQLFQFKCVYVGDSLSIDLYAGAY